MKKEAYLFLERNSDTSEIQKLKRKNSLELYTMKNNMKNIKTNKLKNKQLKNIIESPTINQQHKRPSQTRIVINNNSSYQDDNMSIDSELGENHMNFGFEHNNENNQMICKHPEHHSVYKKINHFDSSHSKKQTNNSIYPSLNLNTTIQAPNYYYFILFITSLIQGPMSL